MTSQLIGEEPLCDADATAVATDKFLKDDDDDGDDEDGDDEEDQDGRREGLGPR